jgi:hypothetical protein
MIEFFDDQSEGVPRAEAQPGGHRGGRRHRRHGSFAAASTRLNKVPSTISYAIGKLEEQLGMQLFERRARA